MEQSSLPLAPEKREVNFENLSPYAKRVYHKMHPKKSKFSESKLLASFLPKERYVVHIGTLALYKKLGLQITKIHRVIKFRQRAFLKDFILRCTKLRSNASNAFEKRQWKLFCNSTYGKMIECVFRYLTTRIVQNQDSSKKIIAQKSFKGFTVINENITALHSLPTKVTMDKLYACGMTILDLAKYVMYDLFYRKIRPEVPSFELLMSDTDSFLAKISGITIDEFYQKIGHLCDFSNYPKSHSRYDDTYKSALFKLKDELASETCVEFYGLRSKCYAFRCKSSSNGESYKKICKGIKRNVVKNDIDFDMYKQALRNEKEIRVGMYNIESHKHQLQTVYKKKVALSAFESKRYLLNCGIHSHPYGSVLISRNQGKCNKCPSDKMNI